ncbi:TIGR01777 family oxidoreductase [Candidatus Protochlamydia phocaeensis]|uniref:TIGR01777 family oxidoreductase n=1 Tax=Candidatus Protochlamydia phocaeensis TaxID=1414722 RepID=UPI000A78271D|nr:TIGR01777 family oxidoreductase [Candidatus Protochlamydia phocaeensis]
MNQFEQSCLFNFPAQEVFDWHKQPGAFERLRPPWMDIEVVDQQGQGIQDGVRVTIKAKLGAISGTQEIVHFDYMEGRQFKDRQLKGPFSYWEHSHLVKALNAQQSQMEDVIQYILPVGLRPFEGIIHPWLQGQLKRVFRYRYATLNQDLNRHQGAKPMKILVTGSSGLVGSALIPFLTTGHHEVIRLVRARADLRSHEVAWDPERGIINPELLEGLDAVIHLAGENIAGIWTSRKKKRIFESRVQGTRLLCRALSQLHYPPSVLVCASAVGYYGNQGDHILTEKSPKGQGFLADICEQWEEATQAAKEKGIRTVNLRIGMVLSPRGGGLKQMLTPFNLGLGGEMGSGEQYISWIAIDDLIGAIYYALRQSSLSGPVNAVSPHPVTNREFTSILGKVLHRPTVFKIPSFVLKWICGEMADEVLLASQRALPEELSDKGFQFYYPNLEQALRRLLGKEE